MNYWIGMIIIMYWLIKKGLKRLLWGFLIGGLIKGVSLSIRSVNWN